MEHEAQIFKALADETRLRIVVLLLEDELCVCEIMAALDQPQSTVSRHLAYLRKRGWVTGRRQGVWMYYRLNESGQRIHQELISLLTKQVVDHPEQKQAAERLHTFRTAHEQKAC